jgi:hypothetical protein
MKGEHFWLFNWLDSYGITSLEIAQRILDDKRALNDLKEMAELASENSKPSDSIHTSIVAGRGLDLSGHLDCPALECRLRQVDKLFRKAWHYFDRILVADSVAHITSKHWDWVLKYPTRLLPEIGILLYLRQIGASDLVEFIEKPPCYGDWRIYAKKVGLHKIIKPADSLARTLIKEGKIIFHRASTEYLEYLLKHEYFDLAPIVRLEINQYKDMPEAPLRKAIVKEAMRQVIPHLTSDIIASRESGVPLGCTMPFYGKLLSYGANKPSPTDVAFNLNLPVLQEIPIELLIKIRRDEQESFHRFQDSLRLAIKEQMRELPSARAEEISNQIRVDIIEPQLRQIRDRLRAAQKTVVKKTAVGVFMGTLVTTCGILADIGGPPAVAAGVGAMVTAEAAATAKYIEEEQQIALSDMYFLWKAVEHAGHKL